ncbi:hypothetical protein LCGC14_1451420 [marine sediment metagenome]|uniref:Uncharacterized protein n=1 Tax=marine sediment metagenome TaxID=412755 RepID=A0A0F9MJI9_9ZZZZ
MSDSESFKERMLEETRKMRIALEKSNEIKERGGR